MKKVLSLLLAVCVLGSCLVGCSQSQEGVASTNEIAPMALTQDQKDIVDLLSGSKQEILLFDYVTEATYTSMECWVEEYAYGELIDSLEGFASFNDTAKQLDGRLAIVVDHNFDTQYSFTLSSDEGGRIINTLSSIGVNDDSLARGYGSINEPVEIVPNKEIVLYLSIHSENSIRAIGNIQKYVDELELLSSYPYVQMIKCRFE